MYKISAIIGSARKDSYNKKVGELARERYKDCLDIDLIDIKDFPLFNEDIEKEENKKLDKINEQIKESDGIIIISPEYNSSIPGGLKNALDWLSRGSFPLMGKPYILMGASQGDFATIRVQTHLRQVLDTGAYQMLGMPNNQFLIARVQDKVDENGYIIDESILARMDKHIEKFINWIDSSK